MGLLLSFFWGEGGGASPEKKKGVLFFLYQGLYTGLGGFSLRTVLSERALWANFFHLSVCLPAFFVFVFLGVLLFLP